MQEFLSEINYDKLINTHLRGVVRDALKIAEENGLPGENHFYITFRTCAVGVEIPPLLKSQYPDNMTIVLQHQFSNLSVGEEGFSVDLVFGGIPYTLVIQYRAVSYFADPYARFCLSFKADSENSDTDSFSADGADSSLPEADSHPAEIISIDKFRKKS